MNISSEHIFVREVSSALESVEELERLLADCADKFSISEELQFKIQVALIEAVNNAIIHGNKEGKTKSVIITFVHFEDFFRICIKDEGNGFDLNSQPDPVCSEKIAQPNGRGLYLIKKLSDNVKFLDRGRVIQIDFLEKAANE